MTSREDRQSLSQDIGIANAAGTRLHLACAIACIDVRTLQRWKADEGLAVGDGRPQAARSLFGHALSDAERAELVCVTNDEHRHNGSSYVTVSQRHCGADHAVLAAQHALYLDARKRNPAR